MSVMSCLAEFPTHCTGIKIPLIGNVTLTHLTPTFGTATFHDIYSYVPSRYCDEDIWNPNRVCVFSGTLGGCD